MAVDPSELPGVVILHQVTDGVAVRMAVLFRCSVPATGCEARDRRLPEWRPAPTCVQSRTGRRVAP